ncbi:MAG: sigma-70 family RNA polymerase sigma factor [Terriglobia bacterium]|jgi:RNA polymerase sigma-70 factor (ECF subfamily)
MDGACLELAGKALTSGQTEEEVERSLIRRAQRGDRAAFDSLVRRYDQEVLRMALRIVQSAEEAQDLYQEAFLRVYRSIGRFRLESKFSTWLYRVVMNVCLDHLRRQKTRNETQMPEGGDGQPDFLHSIPEERPVLNPERALQTQEIGARLQAAMTRLSPRERMVFELKHCQGMKLRAIGELCGTSEEAAKNSLFRALQKLRGDLQDLV